MYAAFPQECFRPAWTTHQLLRLRMVRNYQKRTIGTQQAKNRKRKPLHKTRRENEALRSQHNDEAANIHPHQDSTIGLNNIMQKPEVQDILQDWDTKVRDSKEYKPREADPFLVMKQQARLRSIRSYVPKSNTTRERGRESIKPRKNIGRSRAAGWLSGAREGTIKQGEREIEGSLLTIADEGPIITWDSVRRTSGVREGTIKQGEREIEGSLLMIADEGPIITWDSVRRTRRRRLKQAHPDPAKPFETAGTPSTGLAPYLQKNAEPREGFNEVVISEPPEVAHDDLTPKRAPNSEQMVKNLFNVSSKEFAEGITKEWPHEKSIPEVHVPQVSLVDEIFRGNEKSGQEKNGENGSDRTVPRLPLPVDEEAAQKIRSENNKLDNRSRRRARVIESFIKGNPWTAAPLHPDVRYNGLKDEFDFDTTTVVTFSTGSSSLLESDFRRAIPKGRHIPAWQGMGDILRVIPGRDRFTLDFANFYYILFSSPTAADLYVERANQLHKLAQQYTPTQKVSPILPSPSSIIGNSDEFADLQIYTLLPPSHDMRTKALAKPYRVPVQKVTDLGGYPQLVVSRTREARAAVLIYFDGGSVTSSMTIKSALELVARETATDWGFEDNEKVFTKLKLEDDANSNADLDNGAANRRRDRIVRQERPRWVIYFKADIYAHRFVRRWHRAPFPMPLWHRDRGETVSSAQRLSYGESPPIIHAEIMW